MFRPTTEPSARLAFSRRGNNRARVSSSRWLDLPDKATIAEIPGKVTKVIPAEQGGHYVHVGDREHYIAHGMEVLVKPGDTVEAGDALGDGIVSPADVVRHRGLGEGRRYYADRLKTILDDSGQAANRRNTEVLARGAMNHVEIGDDDVGNHLPGSLTTYDSLMRDYHAPASARVTAVKSAEGRYLRAPVMHYTVGTKLTPRMVQHLSDAGVASVMASDDHPGFEPVGNRLATAVGAGDDWISKQQGRRTLIENQPEGPLVCAHETAPVFSRGRRAE